MTPFFFFGSLRDRDLLEVVLSRPVHEDEIVPAHAQGVTARTIAGESYPYLARSDGDRADGVLFTCRDETDQTRLEWFEDIEYGLATLTVETQSGSVEATYFAVSPDLAHRTRDDGWDFAVWQRDEKAVAIEAAREHMGYLGKVSLDEIDALWHGIKIRAIMRARAKATPPAMGRVRTARTASDVETLALDRPYARYFAVEETALRHRRHDGTWSPDIQRTTFATGDAVTVVPYDARLDRVLLVEQFRTAMHARGDACPWAIEAVAGRLDKEESAEACARREAMEEAGLALGRLERIAAYYTSPGFATETITSFIGEADLTGQGGVFGVADENEDIRAFTLSFDEAMEGVGAGEIDNAPAILSLLWLGQQRARLRDEWG